jgi:hypothetical protein
MQTTRPPLWAVAWPIVFLGALCPLTAVAAESDDNATQTVRLDVWPAVAPRPALKIELLPNIRERRPGNAAVHYNKIGLNYPDGPAAHSDLKELDQWLEVPLAQLPRDKVRAYLDKHQRVLDDIALAARRDQCDWELPIREQDFVTMILPEVQRIRSFARLLQLQARLQIVEGRLDDALDTFRTGYAIGRHVAAGTTFISDLVGMAICGQMSKRIEEMIQQPGAPNLYWALTALPRPLIDLRSGAEAEPQMLYLSYPEFADLESRVMSPQQWQQLLDRLLEHVQLWHGRDSETMDRLWLSARTVKGYPMAKQYLIGLGHSSEEVEAMPVAQVVLIYTMRVFDDYRDDTYKWLTVPYWQARRGLRENNELLRHAADREIVPIASLLLPAVENVSLASARSQRSIAMLCVIEALRLYGAAHDGKLPARLSDITEVPLPEDPLSGGPFLYRLDGDAAVLEAPLPEGLAQRGYGAKYEIHFAK